MGCDIHAWAEVYQRNYENKFEWNAVGKIWPYPYHSNNVLNTFHYFKDDEDESDEETWESNKLWSEHPYMGRNYMLFSLLANVRNNGTIVPLDSPRGVPDNASAYYKHQVESWNDDGHSHSYFNLEELEKIDWENQIFGDFVETISRLQELKDYDNVYDVRLVFFFDN